MENINPYLNKKSFLNIPLNWYSKYIYNYLEKLDFKYKKDDYSILFDEIYCEENKKLKNLKLNNNIAIIRNDLNFRNIENFLKKIAKELNYIKKFENNYYIVKFIYESDIVVFFNFNYDFVANTYKYTLNSKKEYYDEIILKNISDFIKQFTNGNSELKEYIKNNIKEGKPNILFDNLFEKYLEFVSEELKKEFYFENKKKN